MTYAAAIFFLACSAAVVGVMGAACFWDAHRRRLRTLALHAAVRPRGNRSDEARLDAAIHDAQLRHLGVVEPDEPTEFSHASWHALRAQRARGEFTPAEREEIRRHLNLYPFDAETP